MTRSQENTLQEEYHDFTDSGVDAARVNSGVLVDMGEVVDIKP